jgi:hypothetical protein
MQTVFISGLKLSQEFYQEIVLPILDLAFQGQPFSVITRHGFAQALLKKIQDPVVKRIAERPVIGSIDLFSDNVDLVSNPSWRAKLRQLYE